MKSFGSLLKRLRGTLQVTTLAERLGVPKSYVVNVEAGRKIPTEKQARRILEHGFGLTGEEANRCILRVLLFDYGVHDEAARDLLIDLIEEAKRAEDPAALLTQQMERLGKGKSEQGQRENGGKEKNGN